MTATATETDHLVRAVNVTKAFGSNEVLKGIDLNDLPLALVTCASAAVVRTLH